MYGNIKFNLLNLNDLIVYFLHEQFAANSSSRGIIDEQKQCTVWVCLHKSIILINIESFLSFRQSLLFKLYLLYFEIGYWRYLALVYFNYLLLLSILFTYFTSSNVFCSKDNQGQAIRINLPIRTHSFHTPSAVFKTMAVDS